MAKSRPVETIGEHTDLLKENLHRLKQVYPALTRDWEILEIAAEFHDLGKINTKFQNKLYRLLKLSPLEDRFPGEEEIPHGNLSVALLKRNALRERFGSDLDALTILYQAIYYHHPRVIPPEKLDYLKNVIKKDLRTYIPGMNVASPYFNPEPVVNFHRYTDERIDYHHGKDFFYRYVKVKGMLNRLDYAASAHIPVEVPNTDLQERTRSFLHAKGGLREIQQYLAERQDRNHIVVASTGIGKTEAGLLWIGNDKGFFTLPLRVSINAIYQRIKQEDIGFSDTALLHSDALAFMVMHDETDSWAQYTRARQLSMPLTITTVDQLFKLVFKEEGFESILATLSYSKVIIDEIQMYSPEIVACMLMGLKYITEIGGKFAILTATFPGVLEIFLKKAGLAYQYAEFIWDMKRHKMKLVEADISEAVDEIIEKGRHSKVLVIVNTVKKAQEVFRLLEGVGYKKLLHSRFIGKDRRKLESDITKFSRGTEAGIWVTTQIVEASLDIDFDVLYTELSTVDGLFQRMGRCYRKRELEDDRVNIHVFTNEPSGVGMMIDREIFELSKEALKVWDGKVLSETDKLAIVKAVYALEKIGETEYYKTIKSRWKFLEDIPAYEFKREEVDRKFRNILSYTVIPRRIFDEEAERIEGWIQELKGLGFSDEDKVKRVRLLEGLKELSVDVPHYYKKHIVDKRVLDKHHAYWIINLEYDEFMGLINIF